MTDDAADLSAELELLTRKAGLRIPADLWAGSLQGYAELRRLVTVIRQPREPESEPAAFFAVLPTIQGRK